MAKRRPKQSERSLRREAERSKLRLANDRERLFQLQSGGTSERPISASSAAVVEIHASGVPCPQCSATQEVVEHAASVRNGVRLREAKLRCRQCGSRRSLWFQIAPASLN